MLCGCVLRQAVVLVNNLGGASVIEVMLVTRRAVAALQSRGVRVLRVFTGPLMTALDMHGVSVSVLPLPTDAATAATWYVVSSQNLV